MSDIPEVIREADSEVIQPTLKSVGYDDLLDDIFGLNFRAFSTVKDIFIRPKVYFQAAKNPSWEAKYTPSLRLVLGLFAIFALFKIIYSNPESTFFQDIVQIDLDYSPKAADDIDLNEVTENVGKQIYWVFWLLPIGLFISWFSLSGLRRVWGEPLNFVVRLRYIFTLVVPLLISMNASSLAELYIPEGHTAYLPSQIFIGLVGFLLVAAVAYRGPLHDLPNPAKIFRALFLAFIIHLVSIIGAFLAIGAALFALP